MPCQLKRKSIPKGSIKKEKSGLIFLRYADHKFTMAQKELEGMNSRIIHFSFGMNFLPLSQIQPLFASIFPCLKLSRSRNFRLTPLAKLEVLTLCKSVNKSFINFLLTCIAMHFYTCDPFFGTFDHLISYFLFAYI